MSYKNFPIPVQDLQSWLPHRPPMVWIDNVLSASETGGECQILLKRDALYMGPEGIRPSSMVEWLAQSLGYIRAAQHLHGIKADSKPPSRTFLVSVRNATFHISLNDLNLEKETLLKFQVTNITESLPLLVFNGSVSSKTGLRLFDARIGVYSD